MDGGVVVMPGVPGLPPGASWDTRVSPHHNGPPVSRPQSDHPCHGHNGPPVSRPPKAPGGSRGTPGRIPSRVPCAPGSKHQMLTKPAAWTTGWLSSPESPGCHPGLLGTHVSSPTTTDHPCHGHNRPPVSRPQSTTRVTTTTDHPCHDHNGPRVSRPQSTTRVTATKSPRRKPGDSGSYAFPRAMRSGFETPDAHEARGMDGGWLSCPESPGCHPGLPGTVAG